MDFTNRHSSNNCHLENPSKLNKVNVALHTFTTERLKIRPLSKQDSTVYQEIFTDSEVTRYTGGIFSIDKIQTNMGACLQANEAKPITYLTLAIELKSSTNAIGFISINWHRNQSNFAEFGLMLHRDQQANGYCNEVLPCLLAHCFERYELDLLCSYTLTDNLIAQHILKSHHFLLCDNEVFKAYLPNAKFWQLSRYDWLNNIAKRA